MQNTGMQGSTPGVATAGRAEYLADQARAGLGRISETAHDAMDRLSQAASQAAARLGEHSEELWALQGRAADTTRSYIREHPLATIGIAIAIGVLLSRLTSRR
jgi:ElaB/YqjD/DUF883 family membrane-anchored ribosome-binding protein